MDFKAITQKIGDFTSKAVVNGMEALSKTTDFTYENLKKTNAVMKNGGDFDAVRGVKKLVVFVLGKSDEISKNVFVQLPMVYSKAWIESATLRFIYAEETPELMELLELASPAVAYYKLGERQFLLSGTEVSEFVKTFDVRRGASPEGKNVTLVDQLANQEPSTEETSPNNA